MGKELVKYENENAVGQAGTTYKEKIDALKITSRETYGEMVNLMLESKRYIKAVKEFYDKTRLRTKAAYDGVLEDIRKYSKPFQDAEIIAKQRIRGWEQIEAERQRKAEAKQRAAIVEAEAKQKAAEEEARKNNEPTPVAVSIPIAIPIENKAKVEGVVFQDNWVGTVVDRKALLKTIIDMKAPTEWVEFKQGLINRFGNSTKGKIHVPGIEWENKKIVKGMA